jgi:ABC-2 type transport system permease protein
MSKIGLIISREYFTRVKKKSFLLTTILVPLVLVAFYAIIIVIAVKGGADKQSIAVVDNAGLFSDSVAPKSKNMEFTFIKNETESSFINKYKARGYQAFLYIAHIDSGYVLHSQSSVSLTTTSALEKIINKQIEAKRMQAQGIDPAKYNSIAADVSVENTIDTKEGGKKSVAGVAYAVSFACGMLIYMMMIIYGTQVMRGVMEEKTNRIAEVIISSVKPFQLMMGKILGIGAVGLTQFAIWIILIFGLQMVIPLIFPDLLHQLNDVSQAGDKASMIATTLQGLSSLPILKIVVSFFFYFLAGYLTYASLFAAIGSVVSEDQQEAQQLMFPILMPIILGFVIMTKAINEPNSSLAVFGSLFPLTSPIVMMGRITYDVPVWQLALSVVLLIGCFFLFTWITGKIYRTGILMYGKKPSWKEMMKWAFKKS